MMTNSNNRFIFYKERIEKLLHSLLSKNQNLPSTLLNENLLLEAINYSVTAGGKRLRPLLIYATAETFHYPLEKVDTAAMSIELVHCYSLIHDDLPAMDNDDLRRGKPTCHKVFNEAIAILAGDALQTWAIEIIADDTNLTTDKRIAIISCLTKAIGITGMANGQSLDLQAENKIVNVEWVEKIHLFKTGKLIEASVNIAAIIAGCNEEVRENLRTFSSLLGLAFQIQDDVLDIEATTDQLGKPQGSDQFKQKTTYPQLVGLEKSKQKINDLIAEAQICLKKIPTDTSLLNDLLLMIATRNY